MSNKFQLHQANAECDNDSDQECFYDGMDPTDVRTTGAWRRAVAMTRHYHRILTRVVVIYRTLTRVVFIHRTLTRVVVIHHVFLGIYDKTIVSVATGALALWQYSSHSVIFLDA